MDALELLKSDHEKVSRLFEQLRECETREEKMDIFTSIREELETHAHLEETYLYPRFEDRDGFEDLIEDGYDEHDEMRSLIEEIEASDEEDDVNEMFEDLYDTVEDHVEEEEQELFPKIRSVLSESELEELGNQLLSEKEGRTSTAA